jgi:signal transduction histidine kinase
MYCLKFQKLNPGSKLKSNSLRIDELFFDVIEELNAIYPDFHFEVNYVPDEINENKLIINLNPILIRQAIQNLLSNCVSYSNNSKAEIKIDCSDSNDTKNPNYQFRQTYFYRRRKFSCSITFSGEKTVRVKLVLVSVWF